MKKTTLWISGILLTLPLSGISAEAEKPQLKLGFVKLTDMAPLAVALEQGFFDDEGLSVQLEAQPNWKVLQDRVLDGQLDAAHMLAGQVLASHAGMTGTEKLQTALVQDLHGNGCTAFVADNTAADATIRASTVGILGGVRLHALLQNKKGAVTDCFVGAGAFTGIRMSFTAAFLMPVIKSLICIEVAECFAAHVVQAGTALPHFVHLATGASNNSKYFYIFQKLNLRS